MVKKVLPVLVTAALFLLSVVLHAPNTPAQEIFETTVFAPVQPGGMEISLETAATGLTAPLKGVVAPGEPNRLYVVDQGGKLWAIDLTTATQTVFFDVSARLVTLGVLGPNTFDERGFLGVAFHPNYTTNGLLYTYTSEPVKGKPTFPSTLPPGKKPDHQNVIAEWRAVSPGNPALGVDPKSRRELMRVDWPQFNHNGGDLAFGPDGMVYISMGDGGGADDRDGQLFIVATGSFPQVDEPIVGHGLDGNGQKFTVPLGKVLRIDVNGNNSANGQYGIPSDNPFVGAGGGVLEEIYAFGFRNPWRFSFDTATGALYVGDVGQNDLEEADLVVSGGNYGWNCKEGTMFFDPNGNDPGFATPVDPGRPGCNVATIDPIAQYDTHGVGHAIIGGHVYRGGRISALQGRYVFGDFTLTFEEVFPFGPFISGRLFYLEQKKTAEDKLLNIQEFKVAGLDGLGLAVLGMGQDASGEVYVTANTSGVPFGTSGVVLRIAPK